jgi:hypothetical protein
LAPALVSVVIFRFFNFLLPGLPALLVHPRVTRLIEEDARSGTMDDRGPPAPLRPPRAG